VNKEVLRNIGKPINPDRIKRLARKAAQLGIRTHATFMFGNIGETAGSMEETLRFSQKLSVDTVQYSIALPYPGTRMYDKLKADGMLEDVAPDSYDLHTFNVIKNPNLSNDELRAFFQKAPGRWLRAKICQPSWVARQTRYFWRGFKVGGWDNIKDDVVKGVCALWK
jgi:radical SAM superfamily enzyme YgiQ (UPF0313 family)